MNRNEGEKILTELFANSIWQEKYRDCIPPDEDGIVYKWSASEADYAMPFFSKVGQSILTEETCVAKRSLYLGRKADNSLCLFVYEKEKESYRDGISDMAREFASMLKVDNLIKDKS